MLRTLRKIQDVYADHGGKALARFVRKAAWERLPLHPAQMPFGPGHLQIEVSGKCNLKCPMCPRTFSDAGFVNMPLATYRRIVESSPGLYSVNLQGYGEPFLNPELEAIVRWSRGRGLEVGFASNGTLLDQRRVRQMIDAGLSWLNVSMDGATPATYERVRVGARFADVVRNVRRLVAMNREEGEPMRLALAYVCMRSNLDEVGAFLELAREVEMPRVFLAPVLDLTAEVPAERLDEEGLARLRGAAARGPELGLDVIVGVEGARFRTGELPCDWPWNKMFVTAEGNVTPCCIENQSFLGNVVRDGVMKVWNAEEYRELRRGLTEGQPHAICRRHCFVEEREGEEE